MLVHVNPVPVRTHARGHVQIRDAFRPVRTMLVRTMAPEHIDHELKHTTNLSEAVPAQPEELQKRLWYEKPSAFVSVGSAEELNAILAAPSQQVKAVEFFAGWCASCKASFPALCKIPQDKKLAGKVAFYKANIEEESLFHWVKAQEVRGLPFMLFFRPDGTRIGGMTSSFKRMKDVKESLNTIVENPTAKRFGLNPQGVMEVRE